MKRTNRARIGKLEFLLEGGSQNGDKLWVTLHIIIVCRWNVLFVYFSCDLDNFFSSLKSKYGKL